MSKLPSGEKKVQDHSLMLSRTGKGTSNLYKAFQTKKNDVESKVLLALGSSSKSPNKKTY